MRTFFAFILIVISFGAASQQRYISSGIIAYSGGAYERAIMNLNYALKEVKTIPDEEAAKAHYYRGVSCFRIMDKDPQSDFLARWPLLAIDSDFSNALSLDAVKWKERIQPLTIDHLKAARSIWDNYDVNFHLGQSYHKVANNYAQAKIARYTTNYNAAVASYEDALVYQLESMDCLNALIVVASILQDQERVHKYRLLAASLMLIVRKNV